MDNKKCSRCHTVREESEFIKNDKTMKTCNNCRKFTPRAEYMRLYRKNNPEKVKDTRDRKAYNKLRLERKKKALAQTP